MVIVLLILSLIIALIISIYGGLNYGGFWENVGVFICVFLMGTVISLPIFLMFIGVAGCSPQVPMGEPTSIELVAVKDNSSINGSFFLGNGTINEDQYYYYLTETSKGIVQQKINIDKNIVYLRYIKEGETPRLEEQTTRCESDVLYFLSSWTTKTEYYFYIPEGSITNDFVIDLE